MSSRRKLVLILFLLSFGLACKLPQKTIDFWIEYLAVPFSDPNVQKCKDKGGTWNSEFEICVDENSYIIPLSPEEEGPVCIRNGGEWVYIREGDPESGCCRTPNNKCDADRTSQEPLPNSESEPVLDDESSEDAPSDDVNLSDLAGTYVGTTNFLDHRVENWGGGAITQNEITITISEDGIVSGAFSVRFESSQKSNGDCVWQSLQTDSGSITGQISQPGGTIKFDYTTKLELIRNCLGGNSTTVTDHHDDFFITISGNTMTGSGDGSKTFEATK